MLKNLNLKVFGWDSKNLIPRKGYPFFWDMGLKNHGIYCSKFVLGQVEHKDLDIFTEQMVWKNCTRRIHGIGIFTYMDDWMADFYGECRYSKYTIHGSYGV